MCDLDDRRWKLQTLWKLHLGRKFRQTSVWIREYIIVYSSWGHFLLTTFYMSHLTGESLVPKHLSSVLSQKMAGSERLDRAMAELLQVNGWQALQTSWRLPGGPNSSILQTSWTLKTKLQRRAQDTSKVKSWHAPSSGSPGLSLFHEVLSAAKRSHFHNTHTHTHKHTNMHMHTHTHTDTDTYKLTHRS